MEFRQPGIPVYMITKSEKDMRKHHKMNKNSKTQSVLKLRNMKIKQVPKLAHY